LSLILTLSHIIIGQTGEEKYRLVFWQTNRVVLEKDDSLNGAIADSVTPMRSVELAGINENHVLEAAYNLKLKQNQYHQFNKATKFTPPDCPFSVEIVLFWHGRTSTEVGQKGEICLVVRFKSNEVQQKPRFWTPTRRNFTIG
jgi:hypothetical protein